MVWKTQTGRYPSVPVLANGKVYLVKTILKEGGTIRDDRSTLLVLNAQNGTSARRELDLTGLLGPTIATITGEVIYVTSGGPDGTERLTALDEQSGAAHWDWKAAGSITGVTVIS